MNSKSSWYMLIICLREPNYHAKERVKFMLRDDDVKRFIFECMTKLQSVYDPSRCDGYQIFRGCAPHLAEQHPGGCERNLKVFSEYNVIPRYCFSCYKVSIVPRNVIELFKILMVFDAVSLQRNNVRKCMVENRPGIGGYYKGYVYCDGLQEAEVLMDLFRQLIDKRVAKDITVEVKRGCSEYPSMYPEFSILDGNGKMRYVPLWQEIEDRADRELGYDCAVPGSLMRPRGVYSIEELYVMLQWLRYAATIGDMSYRRVCQGEIASLENVNREPFTGQG